LTHGANGCSVRADESWGGARRRRARGNWDRMAAPTHKEVVRARGRSKMGTASGIGKREGMIGADDRGEGSPSCERGQGQCRKEPRPIG